MAGLRINCRNFRHNAQLGFANAVDQRILSMEDGRTLASSRSVASLKMM